MNPVVGLDVAKGESQSSGSGSFGSIQTVWEELLNEAYKKNNHFLTY
ncbi:hypothetical protein ACQKMY_02480 [Peribacillus frigoritolerans]